jgi:hypothetical protein
MDTKNSLIKTDTLSPIAFSASPIKRRNPKLLDANTTRVGLRNEYPNLANRDSGTAATAAIV